MSGIIISAVCLLEEKELTEERVRKVLDRHLCRCGSHNRVVKAILSVAR